MKKESKVLAVGVQRVWLCRGQSETAPLTVLRVWKPARGVSHLILNVFFHFIIFLFCILACLTGCHHGTVEGIQTATTPLPQGSNDLSEL